MNTETAMHEEFMGQALELARQAAARDEVPIGALLVKDGQVLGRGFNQPICTSDPSAHAEIMALREGSLLSENYRLPGTTLYVTIEPCTMCIGAIVHARVAHLVFGAREPRAGAVVSQLKLDEMAYFNHRPEVTEGVRASECGELLQQFFAARRIAK